MEWQSFGHVSVRDALTGDLLPEFEATLFGDPEPEDAEDIHADECPSTSCRAPAAVEQDRLRIFIPIKREGPQPSFIFAGSALGHPGGSVAARAAVRVLLPPPLVRVKLEEECLACAASVTGELCSGCSLLRDAASLTPGATLDATLAAQRALLERLIKPEFPEAPILRLPEPAMFSPSQSPAAGGGGAASVSTDAGDLFLSLKRRLLGRQWAASRTAPLREVEAFVAHLRAKQASAGAKHDCRLANEHVRRALDVLEHAVAVARGVSPGEFGPPPARLWGELKLNAQQTKLQLPRVAAKALPRPSYSPTRAKSPPRSPSKRAALKGGPLQSDFATAEEALMLCRLLKINV